jgi:alpha/beta superfamily hydrolase
MTDNTGSISFSGRFEACTRNSLFLIITLAMVFSMNNSKAESSIEIAPGLVGIVHEPAVTPVGLVVISPGAGYDMSQSLITDAAEKAASLGYRALRFNWRYVTAKVERGDGIENEVRDLKDAVNYLKSISPEGKQMILIGKSLGSIVSANVAGEGAYPVILLTPVCRSEVEFNNFYGPTGNMQVMIAGDQDPLCKTEILFRHVDPSTKVSILKGDHGFEGATSSESKRNRAAVRELVGYWLEAWAR